ncbi:hypothetical protein N9204_00270 [bacterium]|nr:hypothetical protein [bacterium]
MSIEDVIKETSKAKAKFPKWPTDPIHATAIIAEELGELQKSVIESVYEPYKGSRSNIRTEALQTAAMCLRFLESLDAGKYEFYLSKQHDQEST